LINYYKSRRKRKNERVRADRLGTCTVVHTSCRWCFAWSYFERVVWWIVRRNNMVIEMKRCMVNIGVHGHHGSISSTVEDPCCTNRTGKRPSKGQL